MKSKYFKIDFKEGIYFSKFSGDKNQIHLNDLVGHNSIYGEKIVHGVYILLKFLKIKNFDYKNMCKLSINFTGHASYDKKIFYKIKKNKKYESITIFHDKFRGICEIKIYYNQKNTLLKVTIIIVRSLSVFIKPHIIEIFLNFFKIIKLTQPFSLCELASFHNTLLKL